MRRADAKHWKLLQHRTVAPRCVEYHRLVPGKDCLSPDHADHGSVITIDVLLNTPGVDFEGGVLTTREADGTDAAHPLAALQYQGLGRDDYRAFVSRYIAGLSAIWPEMAAENLYKPNLNVPPLSANASLVRVRARADEVLVDLAFPAEVHEARGAPGAASGAARWRS